MRKGGRREGATETEEETSQTATPVSHDMRENRIIHKYNKGTHSSRRIIGFLIRALNGNFGEATEDEAGFIPDRSYVMKENIRAFSLGVSRAQSRSSMNSPCV